MRPFPPSLCIHAQCDAINGTEGLQFRPLLDDNATLYIFSEDIMRWASAASPSLPVLAACLSCLARLYITGTLSASLFLMDGFLLPSPWTLAPSLRERHPLCLSPGTCLDAASVYRAHRYRNPEEGSVGAFH